MEDKKLVELARRIKPLIRIIETDEEVEYNSLYDNWQDGDLYFIEPCDLRDMAFTWDPTPVTTVKPSHLKKLGEITTRHKDCEFVFKPSIEEVIEQIPNTKLPFAVAFELHDPDLTPSHDGINPAKVTLYGYEKGYEHPEDIKNQDVILSGETYEKGQWHECEYKAEVKTEDKTEPEM